MPNYSQVPSFVSNVVTSGKGNQPIDLTDPSLRLAMAIAHAAEERKGADVAILRVADVSPLADYFVIVTGFSKVQVRAIARSIEEKVEEDLQRAPAHIEGQAEGTWILLDYEDVIVHTMLSQERDFYNLEAFWGHAERVNLEALAS
ncbi:ribosome silencing factor [Leptothermofonsia sp. ETS-13]|uniref:ribosome silencing factor n=1 Tax=Leptothermofonsia sp. ETS-13 TaxID=3035696 RepID=UPI003BA3C36A